MQGLEPLAEARFEHGLAIGPEVGFEGYYVNVKGEGAEGADGRNDPFRLEKPNVAKSGDDSELPNVLIAVVGRCCHDGLGTVNGVWKGSSGFEHINEEASSMFACLVQRGTGHQGVKRIPANQAGGIQVVGNAAGRHDW